MPLIIVRQDITKMRVDAIVNMAGVEELQQTRAFLAPIEMGEAVIIPSCNLSAKYIIYTADPGYGKDHVDEEQLRLSYESSLRLAVENHCDSIAFPLSSTGLYGYPKDQALRIATTSIRKFLDEYDLKVYLVVFDKTSFRVSEDLLGEVVDYLDKHYVDEKWRRACQRQILGVEWEALDERPAEMVCESPVAIPSNLDDLVGNLDEPFSETLLRLIDAKGRDDVEVYKRANLDRKLFSKIRSNKAYMPSKRTAIAFAVALELSIDETKDLLKRAGFALSRSQKFDVIIEYFIRNGKYDIFEINEVLFSYDLPLLGG